MKAHSFPMAMIPKIETRLQYIDRTKGKPDTPNNTGRPPKADDVSLSSGMKVARQHNQTTRSAPRVLHTQGHFRSRVLRGALPLSDSSRAPVATTDQPWRNWRTYWTHILDGELSEVTICWEKQHTKPSLRMSIHLWPWSSVFSMEQCDTGQVAYGQNGQVLISVLWFSKHKSCIYVSKVTGS